MTLHYILSHDSFCPGSPRFTFFLLRWCIKPWFLCTWTIQRHPATLKVASDQKDDHWQYCIWSSGYLTWSVNCSSWGSIMSIDVDSIGSSCYYWLSSSGRLLGCTLYLTEQNAGSRQYKKNDGCQLRKRSDFKPQNRTVGVSMQFPHTNKHAWLSWQPADGGALCQPWCNQQGIKYQPCQNHQNQLLVK